MSLDLLGRPGQFARNVEYIPMAKQFNLNHRDLDTTIEREDDQHDVREILRDIVSDRGGERALREITGWSVVEA